MPEGKASSRKVLLIGWDAADWKVIRPLMAAGKMPNFSRLESRGCSAAIATLQPNFSPMLWTSIATGKRAFDHGVHGFTEPRRDGRGVQRITNLSRKCKALWNILGQSGLRSIVVGWWPSYPAEPIAGVMVSDQFHRCAPEFKLVPGMVHPPELGEDLAALRLNPEDLPADLLSFFVPRALEIDQQKDHRLLSVARTTAECANIHTAATWLMDREPWDLCAVYFDAIDHFGHGFMKYNPPRQAGIAEEDFDLYNGVLQAGYQLHDKMLGTLLAKAGDDATVILVSDHGFHPDHLRPAFIPQLHAGPASEHRSNGVFLIAGPGIRQGADLGGVGLLDVTPTVLNLFGLPSGADMEGRTISAAFENLPEIQRIPTWEKVDGKDGCHPPHMQLDAVAATESLEQLVALGYVEEPDADHEKATKRTLTDLRTNLAEAFQDAGRHTEASAILRELRDADPDDQRVALRLFISCQALRQISGMESIAEDWAGRRRDVYETAIRRLNDLRTQARELAKDPRGNPAEPALSQEQRSELKRLRRTCRFDPSLAKYFEAQIHIAKRNWAAALEALERIPAGDLIRPGLFTDKIELLGRLGRWSEAQAVLQQAIAIDANDSRVHLAACRLSLHKGDFTAAASSALTAIALLDTDPRGHYLLGIALVRLGLCGEALIALRAALSLNPNFPEALLWIGWTYRHRLQDSCASALNSTAYSALRAARHNLHEPSEKFSQPVSSGPPPRPVAFAASSRVLPPITDEVVIVSGLPRSGTSMLMQMLVAGGLTPLTDGLRNADEDNPRGYFEYEPVRQMAKDTSWLEDARGKVVKIVAPMIQNLPQGIPCRVILIERNLEDILASQRKMIERRGGKSDAASARENRLKQEYLRLIVWTKGYLAGRPQTKLMCVNRNAVIGSPARAAAALNSFLGGNLSESKMAAEVKPELDRQTKIVLK